MNKLEKYFVDEETSIDLIEIGFDDDCISSYKSAQTDQTLFFSTGLRRPLFDQVFDWFENNHSLYVEIQIDQSMEPKFCFSIDYYNPYLETGDWTADSDLRFLYYTKEEAKKECVKRLIKIVKEDLKIEKTERVWIENKCCPKCKSENIKWNLSSTKICEDCGIVFRAEELI